jgi:Mn-dependent DtxR family transcriptional regulator
MPADLTALALQRKLERETDPAKVAAIKKRLKARPAPVPDDLTALKKDDLLDLADDRGVDVPSSATKADIIEAIEGT